MNTSSVLIKNCGQIVTGNLRNPVAIGDTILVVDGRISAVGPLAEIDVSMRDLTVIDAAGLVATPGLIDGHLHMVFGDWSPRMRATGWLAGYVQAGITTGCQAGAFLLDSYPTDRRGMVALGVSLARAYARYRPGGMKVHGSAISLVAGLEDADFEALASEGVFLLAEIGVESLIDPVEVRAMLDVAHRHGFKSRVHFGPEAVPGSHAVTAQMAIGMGAQIALHVNGGPTAPTIDDLDLMIEQSDYRLELSITGNEVALIHVARRARELGMLDRLLMGSDTPTGSGVLPRAILRTVNTISTLAEIPATEAIAIATGNAADAYGLDVGRIEPGRAADILLLDAPIGSQADDGLVAIEIGDLPAIGLVMIDGEVIAHPAANTMRPKRSPTISEA